MTAKGKSNSVGVGQTYGTPGCELKFTLVGPRAEVARSGTYQWSFEVFSIKGAAYQARLVVPWP